MVGCGSKCSRIIKVLRRHKSELLSSDRLRLHHHFHGPVFKYSLRDLFFEDWRAAAVARVILNARKTCANGIFRTFKNLRETAVVIKQNACDVFFKVANARCGEQITKLTCGRQPRSGAQIENTQHATNGLFCHLQYFIKILRWCFRTTLTRV